MKMIWVRFWKPEDEQKLIEWMENGDNNYFDPECLAYPATARLMAHNDKALVAMPVQSVLLLESLGVNPEATKHEVAVGLNMMVQSLVTIAQTKGIGEIYFLATNEKTNEFAKKHGFESLPWPIYRLKIPHLGEQNESIQEGSN